MLSGHAVIFLASATIGFVRRSRSALRSHRHTMSGKIALAASAAFSPSTTPRGHEVGGSRLTARRNAEAAVLQTLAVLDAW